MCPCSHSCLHGTQVAQGPPSVCQISLPGAFLGHSLSCQTAWTPPDLKVLTNHVVYWMIINLNGAAILTSRTLHVSPQDIQTWEVQWEWIPLEAWEAWAHRSVPVWFLKYKIKRNHADKIMTVYGLLQYHQSTALPLCSSHTDRVGAWTVTSWRNQMFGCPSLGVVIKKTRCQTSGL